MGLALLGAAIEELRQGLLALLRGHVGQPPAQALALFRGQGLPALPQCLLLLGGQMDDRVSDNRCLFANGNFFTKITRARGFDDLPFIAKSPVPNWVSW